MAKLDWKEFGMATLLGVSVFVFTGMVAKLMGSLPWVGSMMGTALWKGVLTVGQALSAGVVAFVTNLLLANWR